MGANQDALIERHLSMLEAEFLADLERTFPCFAFACKTTVRNAAKKWARTYRGSPE